LLTKIFARSSGDKIFDEIWQIDREFDLNKKGKFLCNLTGSQICSKFKLVSGYITAMTAKRMD